MLTTNTAKPMSTTAPPADALPESPLPPGGETAWIEVIQKMDEVYNDLLQYEVALEEKNAALEESHQFIESVLASMSDILIVCDRNGTIEEVNPSLAPHRRQERSRSWCTHPLFDLFADEADEGRGARHLHPPWPGGHPRLRVLPARRRWLDGAGVDELHAALVADRQADGRGGHRPAGWRAAQGLLGAAPGPRRPEAHPAASCCTPRRWSRSAAWWPAWRTN